MVLQPAQRITRNPPTPPMTIPSTPSPAPINQPDAATKAADCTTPDGLRIYEHREGLMVLAHEHNAIIRRHMGQLGKLVSEANDLEEERDRLKETAQFAGNECIRWAKECDNLMQQLAAATKERDDLAAIFGKCQSELHALRTDNDTLAVENEKLRRILLRYLSSFDFAGGIATPINQLETLKVLLENEHLHPKA